MSFEAMRRGSGISRPRVDLGVLLYTPLLTILISHSLPGPDLITSGSEGTGPASGMVGETGETGKPADTGQESSGLVPTEHTKRT